MDQKTLKKRLAKPKLKPEYRPLSRREFIEQYVLNRAKGRKDGLYGPTAAENGAAAYDKMEKLCLKTK